MKKTFLVVVVLMVSSLAFAQPLQAGVSSMTPAELATPAEPATSAEPATLVGPGVSPAKPATPAVPAVPATPAEQSYKQKYLEMYDMERFNEGLQCHPTKKPNSSVNIHTLLKELARG